jgi:D-glycero-D-manno-heptose 1,7-bisphosphate phosphatase
MLYLFDADGTLRRPLLFSWLAVLASWDQRILPGRIDVLRRLKADGHRLGVASNQGAVAFGLISEARSIGALQETNRRLGGMLEWIRICPHHPAGLLPRYRGTCSCRKPAPGMLLEALTHINTLPAESVYVGDRATDLAAAQAAGFRFVWAGDFFPRAHV